MISEIDIADWEKIDLKEAEKALDKSYYHQDVDGYMYLWRMFKDLELIQKKQVKQVPALFKEPNG